MFIERVTVSSLLSVLKGYMFNPVHGYMKQLIEYVVHTLQTFLFTDIPLRILL